MNPKKEFIKAVMSVLRLEQNIYVTASLEEILDRIDVSDYTMFISYLGERDSDYEKPMQQIAKGVEEFYNLKLIPHKAKAEAMAKRIKEESSNVWKTVDTSLTNEEIAEARAEAEDGYQLQGEEVVKNRTENITSWKQERKSRDMLIRFKALSPDNKLFKDVPTDVLSVMKFCDSVDPELAKVYEYFLKDKIRPSITQKIQMPEEDNTLSIAESVREMLPKQVWG